MMKYLIRLDDASEYMDAEKWIRIEKLLEKYGVKPIVGIIPHNEDPQLIRYGYVENFWDWARQCIDKGWTPALHGYNHVFETNDGGINPVNDRSEFAGVTLECQCEKIRNGYKILQEHGITPKIFFAPAHTFDNNTLKALEQETTIRIISDTIANDVYYMEPFYFIPQQSGRVRRLPFKVVTFCYHPNIMDPDDFAALENFIIKYKAYFIEANGVPMKKRKYDVLDLLLKKLFFIRRS